MTYDNRIPLEAGRVIVTRSEYDQLSAELEALRTAHRLNLAERLRHARDFGVMGDQDDQLAAFEDAAIDEGRISQLERLLAIATVIPDDAAADGAAGLGTIVSVRDDAGGTIEYELVGVRSDVADRRQVTPGSPIGQALFGARAGDTVRVQLPSGRERVLTVLDVRSAEPERAAA